MSRAEGTPVVVMGERVLGDVELVLLGILPSDHVLGHDVAPPPAGGDLAPAAVPPRAALPLDPQAAAAALEAGRLLLVDEEQTPIASLVELTELAGAPANAPVLVGELHRERHRESGSGRAHRLDETDLARPWPAVLVLARPMTDTETLPDLGADGELLVLVPDDASATDGVPTSTMLTLALEAVTGHPAQVRTAPLRWRGAASDAALRDRLALALGTERVDLRHPDPAVDPSAPAWVRARRALEESVDDTPVAGLAPSVEAPLRRWRPARPHRGVAVMFTGLSGSGKSTLARAVRDRVTADTTRTVSLLDGDVVRHLLSSGLGFDRASRIMNVRRIGFVAAEVARHGGMALCAPIAPYESVRADVARMVGEVGDFILVYVSTPLAECERRDLKGLYAAARAGRIPEFTGISDPYDEPVDADVVVDTSTISIEEGTERVLRFLADGGWIGKKTDDH